MKFAFHLPSGKNSAFNFAASTIPPRVEYQLTNLGRTLLQPIQGLAKWAGQNREKIQEARGKFDARKAKSRVTPVGTQDRF